MNNDEFAFANQQLAGMLRSGIPLESALGQLTVGMKSGRLQEALEKLRERLGQGLPLRQAVSGLDLPELYVRMMQIGSQSNDLPAILTLLADYYQNKAALSTRLQGLLLYPALVLIANLTLSIFLAIFLGNIARDVVSVWTGSLSQGAPINHLNIVLFTPIVVFSALALAFAFGLGIRRLRNVLAWRMAGFREANVAQFAATLQVLLKQGATLTEALGLLQQMEKETPLGEEIKRWQGRLAAGEVKSTDLAANSKIMPPLFFWLIAGDEENWISGLGRAAELYYRRAMAKIDTLLYTALPVSILVVGVMIIGQVYPLLRVIVKTMDSGFFTE